jgi:hypothetical protein
MKLAEALLDVSGHLREMDARFAIVGGIAASIRGEVRFTRDVDIAVVVDDDAQAEQCIYGLQQRGLVVVATVEQKTTGRLATARLNHPGGVVCDLVFATCGIEREVVAHADDIEVFPGQTLPTASVEALLAMKTLSSTSARPRDLEDIRAIVRANPRFDATVVLELLGKIEARGYARGQRLAEKWNSLRVSLA